MSFLHSAVMGLIFDLIYSATSDRDRNSTSQQSTWGLIMHMYLARKKGHLIPLQKLGIEPIEAVEFELDFFAQQGHVLDGVPHVLLGVLDVLCTN